MWRVGGGEAVCFVNPPGDSDVRPSVNGWDLDDPRNF